MVLRGYEQFIQDDLRDTTQYLLFGFYMRAQDIPHAHAGKHAIRARGEHWLQLDKDTGGEYQSPNDRRNVLYSLGNFFRAYGPVELAEACEERLAALPTPPSLDPEVIGGHDPDERTE